MAKKILCSDCKNFDNKNCTHKKNIGIKIKYRKENKFFISTPQEINQNGKCEFYAKLSKK